MQNNERPNSRLAELPRAFAARLLDFIGGQQTRSEQATLASPERFLISQTRVEVQGTRSEVTTISVCTSQMPNPTEIARITKVRNPETQMDEYSLELSVLPTDNKPPGWMAVKRYDWRNGGEASQVMRLSKSITASGLTVSLTATEFDRALAAEDAVTNYSGLADAATILANNLNKLSRKRTVKPKRLPVDFARHDQELLELGVLQEADLPEAIDLRATAEALLVQISEGKFEKIVLIPRGE